MEQQSIDIGKVALTLGGNWNAQTSYERLTHVLLEDDGCGYVSLRNNINVKPGTDDTVWQKATQAGKSIYELCVKHGTFIGTEEEFVAAYNNTLATAAQAAALANAAAQSASAAEATIEDAERLRQGAETGRTQAETQRENAESSRQIVENARVAAEQNRENTFAREMAAVGAATDNAEAAAALASTKAGLANTAAQTANTAAGNADTKAALAQTQADRAKDFADHPNRINTTTYHWEKWDEESQAYVDTGIMATSSPYAGFEVDQATGQLVCTTDEFYGGPTFSLDTASGQLQITV